MARDIVTTVRIEKVELIGLSLFDEGEPPAPKIVLSYRLLRDDGSVHETRRVGVEPSAEDLAALDAVVARHMAALAASEGLPVERRKAR